LITNGFGLKEIIMNFSFKSFAEKSVNATMNTVVLPACEKTDKMVAVAIPSAISLGERIAAKLADRAILMAEKAAELKKNNPVPVVAQVAPQAEVNELVAKALLDMWKTQTDSEKLAWAVSAPEFFANMVAASAK
jgi:hypothetical protein